MFLSFSPPPSPSPLSIPHAHNSHPMSILRRLTPRNLNIRRVASVAAAARQDTTLWSHAPLSLIEPAAESLFHITIDVSDSPDVVSSHSRAGQYLQLRIPDVEKPSFLAIASPPSYAAKKGAFEFLVKSVPASTAELLCRLKKGDVVELTQAMGGGFDIDRISPPEKYCTVLIFATGSGIRFKEWESSGVKIVPVLSEPDDRWTGESGYVQAAFSRAKQIDNPVATGAVLCGQKQMAEEVTSILLADGVSSEKILKNF
ncbi:fruit protein pKIWI502 isoform X2 [Ricinus communis]|uniref:fruit protein pKIWI502 isoform X2 n=1 Tax=Ricinus communis TaxID=3988 RepID=UPI00201A943C|nr:fruit protein pKIWI502 isoform X2 [Ricinus communis]